MKKKVISVIVALACAFSCAVALAACGGEPPTATTVLELLVAKTGEQATAGNSSVNTKVTYGETPDLAFYKLYLLYSDGKTEEIALTDEKLTVEYFRPESGEDKKIDKLPDEYTVGTYSIKYVYDGNSKYKATVNIIVTWAESGAFSVQPAKTVWYENEETPSITVKNPKGATVERSEGVEESKLDDTNGLYFLYYIQKSVYDTFTVAQKTDYEFIMGYYDEHGNKGDNEFGRYIEGDSLYVGEYMLFAEVYSTHNYSKIITPAVAVSVKSAWVERTFTFQNIVVKDRKGDVVTDGEETDFVYMAESMNTDNQGKTVICKENGEVRGTVDFGGGVFDELTDEEVYTYEASGELLLLFAQGGNVGNGNLSGNTLTLIMPTGTDYYFEITFTC